MRPFTSVSTSHPARFELPHVLASFIATRWRKYRHQRRLRATMRILQKLDDRCLKDIGLTRSEIEPAIRHLPYRRSNGRIDLYGIMPRG